VRIAVYTTAYRRIAERTVWNVPAGVRTEPLPLTDLKGRRLSNGMYHVTVLSPDDPVIAKWMVLR
jgi:hypothetical protein